MLSSLHSALRRLIISLGAIGHNYSTVVQACLKEHDRVGPRALYMGWQDGRVNMSNVAHVPLSQWI